MRLHTILALALLLILVSPSSEARENRGDRQTDRLHSCDLIPQDGSQYPVRGDHSGNMSEKAFKQIIKAADEAYGPIFRDKGLDLMIRGLWDDDTANAIAYPGKEPIEKLRKAEEEKREIPMPDLHYRRVDMFGGLARHPMMTADGFLLVLCHEMGHHIGGVPVKPDGIGSYFPATEGQSDYFGAAKCMRIVLAQFNNYSVVKKMKIDSDARNKCLAVWGKDEQQREDAAICMRTSMAGKALALTLASLGEEDKPHFDTPERDDQDETKKRPPTDVNHPRAQCRLDTYFNGALCTESSSVEMPYDNVFKGACTPDKSQGNIGKRPTCWFNERIYEKPDLATRFR